MNLILLGNSLKAKFLASATNLPGLFTKVIFGPLISFEVSIILSTISTESSVELPSRTKIICFEESKVCFINELRQFSIYFDSLKIGITVASIGPSSPLIPQELNIGFHTSPKFLSKRQIEE